VLALYDALLFRRDDAVVRLNRIVAVAEVKGVETALYDLEALDRDPLRDFAPYHAVRADLLRRAGRGSAAREAYDAAIAKVSTGAEREWLTRQRDRVDI
jgi:RNA polymerase sigma-70 factor (ECF subfamily)